MPYVVLGLGSNKSYNSLTSVQLLERACADLGNMLEDFKVSHLYKTAPMYVNEQDDFYNMAVSGYFKGDCHELLKKVNSIESLYGRDRKKEIRNGPRSLDIDIELFGSLKIEEDDLTVPHPRLFERAFVLKPMLDIISENSDIKREFIKKAEIALKKLADQRIQEV